MIFRKDLYKIVVLSLAVKIGYLLLAIISYYKKTPSLQDIIDLFYRNDSGWYFKIAENWYPRTPDLGGVYDKVVYIQSPWAFFPFYPGLLRLFSSIFNIPVGSAALIVSLLFSTGLFLLIYLFFLLFFKNQQQSFFATLVYILYPFNYHFSVFYTEAVFLFFLLLSFYLIAAGNVKWLSLTLIPVVLVRPNGIICLLPLFISLIENLKTKEGKNFARTVFLKKLFFKAIFFLPALLSFLAYLYYQRSMTGHYNAFSLAQNGWGKQFRFPFMSLFREGYWDAQLLSFYIIIVTLYALFITKKIPVSWSVFLWINLLLPLCAGTVVSMARYISVLFPLYFLFAKQLYRFQYKYAVLGIFFCLQLFLFSFWLQSHPISF